MANKKPNAETVSMTVSIPKAVHTKARVVCVNTGRTLNEAVTEAHALWAKTVAT